MRKALTHSTLDCYPAWKEGKSDCELGHTLESDVPDTPPVTNPFSLDLGQERRSQSKSAPTADSQAAATPHRRALVTCSRRFRTHASPAHECEIEGVQAVVMSLLLRLFESAYFTPQLAVS